MVSLLTHHQMLLKGYFRVQFPSEACCHFFIFFPFFINMKILPDSLKELATCGCSSMVRTSVFQTGYVSSILITRSKIYNHNPSVNKRQAYLGFPFPTQIRKTNATYFWDQLQVRLSLLFVVARLLGFVYASELSLGLFVLKHSKSLLRRFELIRHKISNNLKVFLHIYWFSVSVIVGCFKIIFLS